jgi:hypothetical protein
MTNKELIEILSRLPQDAEVLMSYSNYYIDNDYRTVNDDIDDAILQEDNTIHIV